MEEIFLKNRSTPWPIVQKSELLAEVSAGPLSKEKNQDRKTLGIIKLLIRQVQSPLLSAVLHSMAYYCKTILDDNSSSALIILGFIIMSPLIVVATALYCSLARRLRLFMCFQPCARAVYKGVKWQWYEDGGIYGCVKAWNTQVKAWV
uniref:Uncharacterized protein n=1 Tax=Sphaerodactylus townsendi TaxID=933632 RepID=A0ACB8EEC1_9SAUR